MRNRKNRGFTLIEVIVAMAVFAIFMIGILNLLDTSTRMSKIETALSDTQENVRFAAYHIMRTARMMGGAVLPFAADIGGADTWISGRLDSNQSGVYATPFGNVNVLAGSDVLTLRGFFEIPPFFTDRNDIETTGTDRVEVRESAGGTVINDFSNYLGATNLFEGRGIVFMGNMDQFEYTVGQVRANSALSGTAPDRILTVYFDAGTAQWSGLNPTGVTVPPVFNTYRVGILESYTYYVRPDRTLMRMRADASAGGATPQPVAINIGGLQIALGVDTSVPLDGQVDNWLVAPTAGTVVGANVIAMRITVLGRTPFQVPDWTEPAATFAVEDMALGSADRSAKWRTIEVAAALRNYLL
jgi:prepilin-type N-terminal cleavage/methylation domain-containing protein